MVQSETMTGAGAGDLRLGFHILLIQAFFSVVLAGLIAFVKYSAAMAALVGGTTGMLASVSFAMLALRGGIPTSAGKILVNFYLAEITKLVVVVVCMVTAFKYMPVIREGFNVLAMLTTFFLTQSASIFVPALQKKLGGSGT